MVSDHELNQAIESSVWDHQLPPFDAKGIIQRSDRLLWWSEVNHANCNMVARVQWSEQEVDRKIKEIIAFYERLGNGFTWSIGPNSTPRSLGERLQSMGFQTIQPYWGMVLQMQDWRRQTGDRLEASIREVKTGEQLLDYVSFRFPELTQLEQEKLAQLRSRYLLHPQSRAEFLLAHLDQQVVGTACIIHKQNQIGYLGESLVHPHFRGKGIYRQLTDYRLEKALEWGCKAVITHANPNTSAWILERYGFHKQCFIMDYTT